MRLPILFAALALAGCFDNGASTYGAKVDFAYAKPNNLGMYDPRATPAGTFYRWNVETNRLTPLGELTLQPGTPSAPRNVKGDRMAGFGVDGLSLGDTKLVETRIGGQFKTDVTDSVRQQYYQSKTALRDYVRARKTEGATAEDMLDLFQPKDPRYRTVVFVAEDRTGNTTFRVGGLEANEGSVATFKIELANQEIVTVSADALSTANCGRADENGGARPVCFTEVIVYDPVIRENGNLDWTIDDAFGQAELSEALRAL